MAKESKSDIMLHPVRLKIMQTLIGGRRLTVQQMQERLPEVPQATLYRHLNKLTSAGLVTVADQKQVRGAVEKQYVLGEQGPSLQQEDTRDGAKEDQMRNLISFMAAVLGDFERYFDQPAISDLKKDGVGYRQARLYMNDNEFQEWVQDIRKAFEKVLHLEPSPDRRCRIVTTMIVPEASQCVNDYTNISEKRESDERDDKE
ncbi:MULTISPECIES: helix-turn-helix domain-containing protein [unclassified Paenibacillus]|uniref:helix-turn-helix domain-containing protein n=1 Tax=unclassified Paenibacillus TaxID=185978 RepID=UPI001AE40D01|nr:MULTISPECIES: helix-turn-helix domain-containing protein [unclassified Paenibacillus]MBP1154519.1 DNA-binding transcriptional ArsR family regulator [Paenibacillus sp. PvP091]MBP1170097.1 DNA-binding transcriptional ArsR family regulator [Paenibacillus sp. PvR098]MBP2441125.1 DNA-binding transcriptional ArsR family regulator [Paenibacillus sp. PvP052]